ncbi:MAG: hypothetical protein IPJ65_11805 [Archangiaceae bacterium]|nr:hypothetical protein [Archangiaceae bacterium]
MLLAVVLPTSHIVLIGILVVLVSIWWLNMRHMFDDSGLDPTEKDRQP